MLKLSVIDRIIVVNSLRFLNRFLFYLAFSPSWDIWLTFFYLWFVTVLFSRQKLEDVVVDDYSVERQGFSAERTLRLLLQTVDA